MEHAGDHQNFRLAPEVQDVAAERQAPDACADIGTERTEERKHGEARELIVEHRQIGGRAPNPPLCRAIVEDGVEIAIRVLAETDFSHSRVGQFRRG